MPPAPEQRQRGLIVGSLLACHIRLTQISICCRLMRNGYDEFGEDLQDSDKLIPAPQASLGARQRCAPLPRRPPACARRWASRARTARTACPPGAATSAAPHPGTPRSVAQGSVYSSEPAREGDAQPETLPHMFNKDWELNLDALEVSYYHLPHGYPLFTPWPPPATGA